jgi:glycosyltransferase involved in cell wall biosynthesis
LRAELLTSGFKRLCVVARGVDTQRFDPARRSESLRARWGARPQTPVALTVGRLAPEKNLDTVLAALRAMRQRNPGVRMVFVGDGPLREHLSLACPDAVFAGVRHGEDLAMHYASADIFLFPSMTETFGNVVPEAMACGLAVVAYNLAAAGQLIRHGQNGLLASAADAVGFCELASRAAADFQQTRAMGAQARLTAGTLDWGRIVEQIEREYLAAMPQPQDNVQTVAWPVMPSA